MAKALIVLEYLLYLIVIFLDLTPVQIATTAFTVSHFNLMVTWILNSFVTKIFIPVAYIVRTLRALGNGVSFLDTLALIGRN